MKINAIEWHGLAFNIYWCGKGFGCLVRYGRGSRLERYGFWLSKLRGYVRYFRIIAGKWV